MSLNYNLTDIKDFDQIVIGDVITQPYETIILSTMVVGISSITEENHKKFFNRLNLIERINGPYLYEDNKPYYIKLEDVKRLIGLRVNVSDTSKSEFTKNIKNYFPTEL